jgi:tripartite-type tricarboxylate transporter receptor subunit TctC
VMFAPGETVMPHVKAGKLRALAVTSAHRATTLPELPTVSESGVPGYDAIGWFGLLAPSGTPPAIVEKISRDANRVLADPEVKQRMLALGAEPSGDAPQEFGRFIHADQAKWANLMRERGITLAE